MNYSNVVPSKNLKDHCEWNNQGWMYRDKPFSRACCSRTRSDGCKLTEGWPELDIRKKILTVKMMRHWHRFPREVMDAPSLETGKISTWCVWSCPCSWTGWLLEVPSLPTQTIPWYTENPQFASPLFSLSPVLTPHLVLWLEMSRMLLLAQQFHHLIPRQFLLQGLHGSLSCLQKTLPAFRGCLIKIVGWAAWDWCRMGSFVLPLFLSVSVTYEYCCFTQITRCLF